MVRTGVYSSRLPDSPSRQLILDLTKNLEQVRIHSEEVKLVHAYKRKSFYERLDRLDHEREEEHNAALNAAAAKRDQRRLDAEETLRQHLAAVEEERKRKEEQERLEKERIEREKAEKERREREAAARLKAERQAKEEKEKRQAEEAERARKAAEEQKALQERERVAQDKKKEEEERRSKAESEAKLKAAEKEKVQAAQPAGFGSAHRTTEELHEQKRYLELHQHLKKFRRYMVDQTKTNPTLKQHMGDMRRTIRKCVGQLLADNKTANRKPMNEICEILKKALTLPDPSVDVRQFIAFPPAHIANAEEAQVPALLVYLLNILAKNIIAQLMAEAGVKPRHAEPLGVLAAQIFSMDAFVYKGCSMIDILISKYRVLCPILWGFYGDEKTHAGRIAMGWWREDPKGPFVSAQTHEERMTGLGAGFAAIALRNFSKSARQNPYPNTHFWKALSNIINVPPAEVQDTHLIVLAAMLRYSGQSIIRFWGDMGVFALRQAIIMFPASLPKKSTPRAMVEDLRDIYATEKHILL